MNQQACYDVGMEVRLGSDLVNVGAGNDGRPNVKIPNAPRETEAPWPNPEGSIPGGVHCRPTSCMTHCNHRKLG